MPDLLAIEGLRAGYGEAVVLQHDGPGAGGLGGGVVSRR